MYKNICIIGLGSLGGFIAEETSKLSTIETLMLIDDDTVEYQNLPNSIYTHEDAGIKKADAIVKYLHNPTRTKIISCAKKYIEGTIKLPDFDLVIDCRDFFYNRGEEIDIRLSLYDKTLIIDAEQNVVYVRNFEGKYNKSINKNEIKIAAGSFFEKLMDGSIKNMIEEQCSYSVTCSNGINIVKKCDRLDLNLGNYTFEKMLYDMNLKSDINIKILGYQFLVKQKTFTSYNDVINKFKQLFKGSTIDLKTYFIIYDFDEYGNYRVTFHPELGGA